MRGKTASKNDRNKRKVKQRTVVADGRTRAVLPIRLPANAIVDQFDLIITADRAALVRALDAADVRADPDPASAAIVIDFGSMRTVNAVRLPRSTGHVVKPWLGTKFDTVGVSLKAESRAPAADGQVLYTFGEIRTERLRIELGTDAAVTELVIQELDLSLPELPSGLSLSIDGGAPVWVHDGLVEPGTSEIPDEHGWTEEAQRRISIADALAEFAGDASNPAVQDLSVVLTSSVPGKLAITVADSQLRLKHRLNFNGRDSLNLEFESEGEQLLRLYAPQGVNSEVSGLHLSIQAHLPQERSLPPLGPPANDVAELVLGHGRAACIRLDYAKAFSILTAVRMPLEVAGSSAEARVTLWQDLDGIPSTVITEAVSEPVSWDEQGETWVTFRLLKPFPVDAEEPVWAALIVNRGEVIWKMAAGDAQGSHPLRLGSPEGPWRALPAVFGSATALGEVSGRVHVMGLADVAEPLAPILLTLENGSADMPVDPADQELRLHLDVGAPVASSASSATTTGTTDEPVETMLRIVSRSAGSIVVSDVDVVTSYG